MVLGALQQATIAVSKTVYTDGTAVSWLPSVGSTGIGLASALSIAGPVAQSPTVLPVPSPQDAPAAQAPATSGSNPSTGGGSPAGPGMFPPATPSGKTITARFSFTKWVPSAELTSSGVHTGERCSRMCMWPWAAASPAELQLAAVACCQAGLTHYC